MFYFGAATSAHQVEGGNHNDWSEWEKENSTRLAARAQRSDWPYFLLKPAAGGPSPLQRENYVSGRGSDHYRRFKEDFALAKKLGHNAHRFSIEWSRIEPKSGYFDEKEIAHYKSVVRELKKQKLEPFVTLWHWTLPLWLRDRGGWLSRDAAGCFARFSEKIADALGGDVQFWLTLNEPEIYATNGYLKGIWPPERKNAWNYFSALRNLANGHRLAYKALKKVNPRFSVGIAKNNIYFEPQDNKLVNRILGAGIDWWWNRYFLDRIENQLDFIGLNYYFHNRVNYGFNKNENKLVSDMGWELYPQGIYYALSDLKRYEKPIYISENGVADAEDKYREWFIRESLHQVIRAQKEGVPVRGYFYWSLTDNFEWDKGFWPRFGLLEVDYKTMKRRIRPSALAYKKLIKEWN